MLSSGSTEAAVTILHSQGCLQRPSNSWTCSGIGSCCSETGALQTWREQLGQTAAPPHRAAAPPRNAQRSTPHRLKHEAPSVRAAQYTAAGRSITTFCWCLDAPPPERTSFLRHLLLVSRRETPERTRKPPACYGPVAHETHLCRTTSLIKAEQPCQA